MQEHVVEVRMLLKQGDDHWKAETVDILIHCLLLLQAEGIRDSEIAALIERRLGRFKEKISTAMREMKR
jgi:phosphoribosyl-ATP pyrophosphohydrolase